jgi:hypothetical protein
MRRKARRSSHNVSLNSTLIKILNEWKHLNQITQDISRLPVQLFYTCSMLADVRPANSISLGAQQGRESA